MKNILVPVDFSPHTEISCSCALELARLTGWEIVLFHSFFEQLYFADGGFATGFESGIMLTDDIILDFYKQKEEKLEQLARDLSENISEHGEKVKVTHIIESGDPQLQILNAIEKLSPEIVVMGSAGLGKKSFLTGSVCKRVMDNCETPVMALPDISRFHGIKNILYATDLQQDDVSAISHIFTLFKGLEIHVHCLHLNISKKDSEAAGRMEKLREDPGLLGYSDRLTFELLSCQDQKKCLMDYISSHSISLITFVPHKKNFFTIFSRQDLTKEDLFLTGLPIMGIS